MFIAHVIFSVSAPARETALAVLTAEAATVRAMPGCLSFLPFADPTDPQKVGVVHEWESAEQFGAYTASPAFAQSGATLRPMMTGKPVSRRFTAALVETVN